PVAHRPLLIRRADWFQQSLAKQRSDVINRRATQRRGDAVGQQGNTLIGVMNLRAGRGDQRRLVSSEGERVVRRRELFPKISLPARKPLVRQTLLLRVIEARGVRTKLAEGNLRLSRIGLPLNDEFRRRIVER